MIARMRSLLLIVGGVSMVALGIVLGAIELAALGAF